MAAYVLDLLDDPVINAVLDEARRVLAASGMLCIVTLTEGATPASHAISRVWSLLHALNPNLVGGCRPFYVDRFLTDSGFRIDHREIVCRWGICSDVVIASRAP